jgi:hypothetical protein
VAGLGDTSKYWNERKKGERPEYEMRLINSAPNMEGLWSHILGFGIYSKHNMKPLNVFKIVVLGPDLHFSKIL